MTTQPLINPITTINEYLNQSDWRVKENANQGYALGGLILNSAGKMTAEYWLTEIYPPHVGQAHRDGDIAIHDLSILGGYCAGWSLRQLLQEGFNGVEGRVHSNPPKHFSSAVGQIVNFLGTMQNEWAGAQAFSSFDTLMAPYVRNDNMTYTQVKQCIQELVYNLNVPSRWGSQAPFTNLTFDWTCPEDLKNTQPLIGDTMMPFTYGDLQEEMDTINKAYIEVMTEGDATGQVFTFPIPTYNITPEFDWDTPNANLLFDMTAKYGTPYFQNFLNSDLNPGDVRSMCPLTGDTKVLVRSQRGIQIFPIDKIYRRSTEGTKYDVWTKDGWANARPVKTPMTDVYEITLSNGDVVKMGENHLQPIRGGEVLSARDLKEGMWLPYNQTPVDTGGNLGTEEYGFAVGAYLGDGSQFEGHVVYSLNVDTDVENAARLMKFWTSMGYKTRIVTEGKVLSLKVRGKAYDNVLARFITGTNAATKGITSLVFDMDPSFRLGLIDGYRATDGSVEKKRLYTTSLDLVDGLMRVFASLGIKARVGNVDRRMSGFAGDRGLPLYRVDYTSRARYGDFYDSDDEYNYCKITQIKNIGHQRGSLYCFEVDNEDHLFTLASGLVTHNCRLQLRLDELLKRGNGLFGSGEQTGSIGVVTVNCARLGFVHKGDWDALIGQLDYLLDISKESLELKRVTVQKLMDGGLFPYSKRYLGTLNSHFSTIGVNGVNEMIRNFTGDEFDLADPRGEAMAVRLLDHIRARMVEFQEETGNLYNLEATPAEGTTYRFARADLKRFGGSIIQAGTKEQPYYTNSTQLPVGYTTDPFEALEKQDELQTKYTGGTVLHLYLGEALPSSEACKQLVRTALESFKLPYMTVTPTFSVCDVHGYMSGEHFQCSTCGKPALVFTRVMGYFRPVSSFNTGKKGEYFERTPFENPVTV